MGFNNLGVQATFWHWLTGAGVVEGNAGSLKSY